MSKIKKLIFLILFFVGIILLNTHVQASGDLYLKKLDFEAKINTIATAHCTIIEK